jgi:hypothetical protein
MADNGHEPGLEKKKNNRYRRFTRCRDPVSRTKKMSSSSREGRGHDGGVQGIYERGRSASPMPALLKGGNRFFWCGLMGKTERVM